MTRLKDNGAKKVYAIVTHGILTADAFAKINECQIETLAITNTVPQKFELCSKIKVWYIQVYHRNYILIIIFTIKFQISVFLLKKNLYWNISDQ